ncbi:MAG TPA: ABC transporter permease [Methanobacteriales archaeon]|nr:MAG: Putative membrane protein [Methanobacteriaceae archaeon 41_258]MBC7089422.1 ABC transporter permease [Methanobacteriaceae archaeon]HIH62327.1 ABC transporter permease [Methanobacteriales archaeon]
MGQLNRALTITKKNILIYYLKGPVIIFGILIPVFFFLAFIAGGKHLPWSFLISGLISMTVFFTATSVSPVIMPWEAQMNTLERLVASPVSIYAIIVGDILASICFSFLITVVPVILALVTNITIKNPLIFVLGIILAATCFSVLGSLLSTPKTNLPSNIMMLSSLIKFPLVFISGIFIPLEMMGWGNYIAIFSPLTYTMEIVRYSMQGTHTYPIIMDIVSLILFTIIFFIASIKLHEANIPHRI